MSIVNIMKKELDIKFFKCSSGFCHIKVKILEVELQINRRNIVLEAI